MPRRFYITKDLDILEFDAVTEWGYPRHNHNFFELTFILKGRGQHILNDSIIDYEEGDIFFLTPKDEHEFVIGNPTKFGIIKFTEQIFLEKATFSTSAYWQKNIETVVFHSNIIAESIVHYKEDKEQFFSLYKLIKHEMNNSLVYNRHVLIELFGAILIVLSRNVKSRIKSEAKLTTYDREKVDTILTYIRQNIFDKKRITIKSIAKVFFMSPNYVGIFIKKHAGISIQQYVMETKVKMAERLLKQSNLDINEIAYKIGFTDSAHFSNTFKKYKGHSPSAFRKQTSLIH